MGRKTFESLGGPLEKRYNIVLSVRHRPDQRVGWARSFEEAMEWASTGVGAHDEAFVIGGAQVFAATAHLWDRLLLTVVDGEFEGDVGFPVGQATSIRWRLLSQETCPSDARNPHAHRFAALERARDEEAEFDLAGWINESTNAKPA